MLRHADPVRDAAACAAIYAPWVERSAVSFESEPPDAAAFTHRIERISRAHPWIVLERDGEVAGFAYASPHRERDAYRWAAEVSAYVRPDARRTGAGRTLYTALFDLLRRQGIRVAYAGITLPNPGSVGLHEALGFRRLGVYERVGYKAGAWHDVGWWALELLPRENGAAPAPPLAPQRLPAQP